MEKKVFIGTSGWVYEDWWGRFYPEDISGADRLLFYAEKFNTVEVNASFYRLPTQTMIDAWNRKLGAYFHLVLKGSRLITHLKKIKNCREPLQRFFDRALKLKNLKVVLWQLPPSLHKDIGRLDRFLSQLPPKVRHAVEFRHESWWDDEVTTVLSHHNAAFVAVSHPTLPDTIIPTTDFLYIRFHGPGEQIYNYDYPDHELICWASRLRPHIEDKKIYAFFNNDFNANAPKNAVTLGGMLL
jgi:uncharacterized protein YecE (DUF72 family)